MTCRWLLLVCVITSPAFAGEIHLTRPWGGWRNSDGEKVKYTQEVNYPASAVRMQEAQSDSAKIEGDVSGFSDTKDPFKLIVNGIAMPLRIDGNHFSRPYSFGAGSSSVEVRSPDGASRTHTQFYEVHQGAQPDLRVVLSWSTDATDLDLHVLSPDGEHCYYGNRVLANGSALDVDVTTGYGPEIYSSPAPVPGTYLVYVNYYGSGKRDDLTVATVNIITHEGTADEKQETAVVPMRKPGDLTLVHSFVYP